MKNPRNHPHLIEKAFPVDPKIYRSMEKRIMNIRGYAMPWSSMSCTAQVAEMGGAHDAHTTGYLMYALSKYHLAERPYWRLDADLADVLIRTDPPVEVLDELPKPPFSGMYIEIPPGTFGVPNDDTGVHDAVGIYLAEDTTVFDGRLVECLCIVAAGEAKGSIVVDGHDIVDDALVYGKWLGLDDVLGTRFSKIDEAWRLIANLLIALQNNLLELKDDNPFAGKGPKKVKRLHRKGAVAATDISLRAVGTAASKGSASSGNSPRAHNRRGHWRSQWVKEPGDRKTYKTKKRENRPDLHKVLLWIHPTRVGKGDVERTITRVRR
jgi:hypothetical protein